MLHSNFRWILCFLKKGMCCVHDIFHYLVSKLSSFLNRECEQSPMSGGCWEEIIGFSTLLLTIPIFLLRIQKGKCLKNKTLCSWLILWYLVRLICTVFWGTDWLYYFGITKVSLTLKCFPLCLKDWGAQWGVWVCGGICIGRQVGKRNAVLAAATLGSWERTQMVHFLLLWGLVSFGFWECHSGNVYVCTSMCIARKGGNKGARATGLKRGFELSPYHQNH